jgi:hypothetical protein
MKQILLGVMAAATLATAPAAAADFSFAGNLSDPNEILYFDFSVAGPSNVTLRTYSYAGGTNAQGTAIARGGFDPILSLYDLASGLRVGQNDDGGCSAVPGDAVTGQCWDTFFEELLNAGNYRVAVTAYSNFGPDQLGDPFDLTGSFVDETGDPRDTHFAFDVLGVDTATGPGGGGGIPEPSTWAMMLAGFAVVGGALRGRRRPVLAQG